MKLEPVSNQIRPTAKQNCSREKMYIYVRIQVEHPANTGYKVKLKLHNSFVLSSRTLN